MHSLVLLLALAAYKPNFDKQYFTKCYDGESEDTCQRRQARWKEGMEQYRKELQEERDRELGYLKKDADETDVKPEAGRQLVPPMGPVWCKAPEPLDEDDNLSSLREIGRSQQIFRDQRYFTFNPVVWSAQRMCTLPDNESVKKLATALVQMLVNSVGYSKEDAIADITARLDEKGLQASKKKLCAELKVSDEAEGDVGALARSKYLLFGCGDADKLDTGLWLDSDMVPRDDLAYWLDGSAQVESETMRLAYLLAVTRNAAERNEQSWYAVLYAMVQLDLPNFDAAKLKKELSGAPYDGNPWAAITISEALGALERQRAEYQASIDQLVKKDEGWKTVLVDAPMKAAKEWQARADKFSAALAASREFEKKAFGPSRKAAKGCSAQLRKDFGAYLKTVKAPTPKEFSSLVVGDSIGSLLLQRLVACEGAEGHGKFAGMLRSTLEEGRVMRGPRFAAVYAAVEALGEVKKDRPKFPLDPSSVRPPTNGELMKRFDDGIESVPVKFYGDAEYGSVVKSVTKQGDKLKIVFITEKFQYHPTVCVNTNRIMRISAAGVLEYWQSCHISKEWATWVKHLDDALIPADLGAGIKPGAFVEVSGNGEVPLAVYADKKQEKLVAWRGFAL